MAIVPNIYNTLTRKSEPVPNENGKIRFFVCGPTVYNHAHLGHARTYIFFDAFVKYLRHLGYSVFYIQNITNIDDKIIVSAAKDSADALQYAKIFEDSYISDTRALGIDSVDKYAPATDFIPQIISQIERLISRGHAYTSNGSVYFSVSSFPSYGELSRMPLDDVTRADRSEENPDKKDPRDFVLWKAQRPGEPKWNSPWGDGRPGWHIEDTAISESLLGFPYEIHGGGIDIMFPHHEAEIAQAESVSDAKPFVKMWMHTGHLTVRDIKMSKSLGNFVTIKQALSSAAPEAIRLALLSTHYRSPLEYNAAIVEQARVNIARIRTFAERLLTANHADGKRKWTDEFLTALGDDFNISVALAVLFECVRVGNKALDAGESIDKKEMHLLLDTADKILGIQIFPANLPAHITALVKEFILARSRKEYAKSDALREEIRAAGYAVSARPDGSAGVTKL